MNEETKIERIETHRWIIKTITMQTKLTVNITIETPQVCSDSYTGDELFREDVEAGIELADAFEQWCKVAPHLDGHIGIAPF